MKHQMVKKWQRSSVVKSEVCPKDRIIILESSRVSNVLFINMNANVT